MLQIKYGYTNPGELRRHYLEGQDIDVILGRLPPEFWSRLRAVHFNDRARGNRCLGYVNRGRREIAICALPPRVSLARFQDRHSPRQFGAIRGYQWPERAVRRFLLYDVFLHELGHLQVIDPKAHTERRRFASETKAQEFADEWRARLWAEPFVHPDPIHNPPSAVELEMLQYEQQSHARRRCDLAVCD
jgi:hypothetical protein